ncbi:hypothetical protein [Cupriavidus sp. BIS7]|uniref:hypothetical protein n=1 Tax=Cupriavidus sp. BIS7 TaxID=1217718 RepID=UPI0002E6F2DD|nr:hypothetical protein [Cupriavidus sp. BIS7]
MPIFLGYFVWGLILAAPLAWLTWRFDLLRWLPRWTAPRPRRSVRLPPQLDALVIRGKRRMGDGGRP